MLSWYILVCCVVPRGPDGPEAIGLVHTGRVVGYFPVPLGETAFVEEFTSCTRKPDGAVLLKSLSSGIRFETNTERRSCVLTTHSSPTA